jgi:hypothetical protein
MNIISHNLWLNSCNHSSMTIPILAYLFLIFNKSLALTSCVSLCFYYLTLVHSIILLFQHFSLLITTVAKISSCGFLWGIISFRLITRTYKTYIISALCQRCLHPCWLCYWQVTIDTVYTDLFRHLRTHCTQSCRLYLWKRGLKSYVGTGIVRN